MTARKKTGKKTARKTAIPRRKPRHGRGELLTGGQPGNAGGTGRPPSAIREHLRGSFSERVGVIEQIADGHPIQRARIPLIAVLPYIVCPNCGESGVEPKEPAAALLVEFDALVSASPKDRLAALDLQAKYGLGALKEVSVENVRERVGQTLDVIRATLGQDEATKLVNALRPVWA